MRVIVSNNLAVENPTSEVLMWAKKNLTIPNPEYAKKSRMGFWTGDTPKTLALYEQDGNILILPFGLLRNLPDCIKNEAYFDSSFVTAEEVLYGGQPVPLYDYQKAAVDALVAQKYGILQSPAGSGKTQMGIALKLVVNTTYGALLNKYNDLFDPLMGRSVCITGQLFLMELAQHLYKDIPGLKIVQLNTDGIMVEYDRKDLSLL